MSGKLSYKKPDLLRMDFDSPSDQVICYNGDMLTVYLPDAAAVLQQSVKTEGNAATLATASGLSLMSRYYTIAYEVGQDPVPLESDSPEKVIKLVLNRRNTSESFRFIKLAVNAETKLIRRVEAVTVRGETFIFNFTDYGSLCLLISIGNIPVSKFIPGRFDITLLIILIIPTLRFKPVSHFRILDSEIVECLDEILCL